MTNADDNAKPQAASLKDWAMKMRQRAVRDLVRATAGDARALAQARKPKRKPRRGEAATAAGLLQQQLAADFANLRMLVRELAELAAWPLPLEGRTPRRRRRARRQRRASAAPPHGEAK